jgi:hypothetical protein
MSLEKSTASYRHFELSSVYHSGTERPDRREPKGQLRPRSRNRTIQPIKDLRESESESEREREDCHWQSFVLSH